MLHHCHGSLSLWKYVGSFTITVSSFDSGFLNVTASLYSKLALIIGLEQCFSTFFGPWTVFLKKYLMDHFPMLQTQEPEE